ncbi:unnamed protein product [Debaryomyces tyrocola]|nr:unnamed protein product [Debaryomyces tyrocola]
MVYFQSLNRSHVFLVGILLLIQFSIPIQGLFHFYTDAGARRCFYKELAQGTLLIGRYKLEIFDEDAYEFYSPLDKMNTGILIDVEEKFDTDHRVVHQKGSPRGQFTFSALESGEHRICLTPKSFYKRRWLDGGGNDIDALKDLKFKKSRIMVDFLIRDGEIFDTKHTHKVNSLTEQVNSINDKLTDIKREQEFIREKEELFRDQSERTCERVIRWLIVQFGALVITCVYQMVALLSFFVKEKIS